MRNFFNLINFTTVAIVILNLLCFLNIIRLLLLFVLLFFSRFFFTYSNSVVRLFFIIFLRLIFFRFNNMFFIVIRIKKISSESFLYLSCNSHKYKILNIFNKFLILNILNFSHNTYFLYHLLNFFLIFLKIL